MSHGAPKIFVSVIVRYKRIKYKNNNFIFVDNSSMSNIHLFDEGLYLVELCGCILANVIDRLNNYLSLHLHHPNIRIQTMQLLIERNLRGVPRDNLQSADFQILNKLRLKYPKNPLIGYLNMNYLRSKLIDVREMIGRLQFDYFVIREIS